MALLSTYRKKRSFGVTAEPRGKQHRAGGHQFVIQKHAATRLHYDLRLELDGVMKSWAVTRGPSLVPGEKRLAVQVEDHPIEYNTFEGTIPKGQYGGGTVLIWDRGRWAPENDPHKGLAKGHLDFILDGEKLQGRFHLVRMHRRPGEKRDNWLLIKSDDEFARTRSDPDILEEKAKSVVSKRTIDQIARAEGAVWHSNRSIKENVKAITKAAKKPAKARPASKAKTSRSAKGTKSKSRAALASAEVLRDTPKRVGSRRVPDFVPPQLATLHDKTPDGAGWIHEVKFDGYRMQARLEDGKVMLLTRKALDWAPKFKPVAHAVAELDAQTALIDGEIVVEDAGVSNFSALQDALKTGKSNFVYYVFDLLHLDGADLTGKPLVERKAALAKLLDGTDRNGVVRLSEHFEISGSDMYRHACAHNLEGLISKRRDAPYRSGRSESWIKTKCHQAQEFVVAGYKDSTHLTGAIGALVLAYYEDGKLRYAGRSGTGYSVAAARDLWQRLQPLRVDKPAFGKVPEEERGRKGIWVEPKLVVEVSFAGWTAQKHVRHAVFKGVREDKPGREIVRETPMPTKSAKKAKLTKPAAKPAAKKATLKPDNAPVKFTHPDRIYWTDVEITKQQLAEYYESVWDLMAPHLIERPLALVRCPEGVGGECFFQKHAAAGLISERIRRIKDEKGEELIYVDDLDGLRTLVQAGVLEIHVWGSTVQDIEHCNRIVFDLDPGDDVPWAAVNKAARELRERLDAIKLTSFVKTTGGKGLHVVVPVQGAGWDEAKDFAHALTLAMAADSPDKYVSKMTKSIRGGKIFIDYLRNGRGATAIVAYSTRARAGAPLSVPVTWDELGPKLAPNKFTLLNIGRRLGALKKDPWADIGKVKQRLPDLT